MLTNPSFIIGSPRSGTKIFRDTLKASPEIRASNHPLEEIWSYGQDDIEHEAYSVDSLTSEKRNFIQQEFAEQIDQKKIFIEKNVRNSLRIPYVRKVFPDARFIHIIREPRDVVTSLMKRWKNPIDWRYYLSSKAFELSLSEIVQYSLRLGGKFLKRLIQGNKHVDIWGPHYPGLKDDLTKHSLFEVCALQWKHCVEGALEARIPAPDNYFELHYETLMDSPGTVLGDLASFMGIEDDTPWLEFAGENFRTSSIGHPKAKFTDKQLQAIHALLDGLPEKLGYDSDFVSEGFNKL